MAKHLCCGQGGAGEGGAVVHTYYFFQVLFRLVLMFLCRLGLLLLLTYQVSRDG